MKPYIILTVEQKPDHIILHTRTNNSKDIDTPEKIAMGIFNLELTCKTDTKNVLISGIIPKSDKLNVKASKENIILRHEFNVRNICFTDNKQTSPRLHGCKWRDLHLSYYEAKKLQENLLHDLAKLDWYLDIVGMCTLSKDAIRVRNKNNCKRKAYWYLT